ncbi:MAG: hypothetical protein WC878_02150 [Candidatus Paceibacterota bacterium]
MKKETKKVIKQSTKKETESEMLARLVASGFEDVSKNFEQMRSEIKETEARITGHVNDRCDRIEYILLRAQDNRIERLEDNMRRVKTALEMA